MTLSLSAEDEIFRAMQYLCENPATIAEPSGAVAVAGFIFHAPELPAGKIAVAILSGGNIDPQMLKEAQRAVAKAKHSI